MHAERVLTRSSREYVCMKREVAPGLPILQLIWIFLALNVWGTIVKQFIQRPCRIHRSAARISPV